MKIKDFLVGWRQFAADPVYSVVVTVGLAVAIGCVYLCAATLLDRILPDPTVPDPRHLVSMDFRLNVSGRDDDWYGGAPLVLRKAMIDAEAPLTGVSRVLTSIWSVRVGDKVVEADGMFADADLPALFGLRSLSGDVANTLARPDAAAITDVFARRLFGDGNALGRQFSLNGQTLTVAAIMPRPAGDSTLQYDVVVDFDSPSNTASKETRERWSDVSGRVFARLKSDARVAQLDELAQSLFDASPAQAEFPPEWAAQGRKVATLRAVSMDRLILDGAGSEQLIPLLLGVAASAFAMLALAAINYINLTTVRTLGRQREIGIRKSLGAGPIQLTRQFLFESVLVTMLAGLVGVGLVFLVAPSFADLISYRFDDRLFTAGKILVLMAGCAAVGLVTGIYPAFLALRVNCAASLAGRDRSETASGRWLRRALTTVQISAGIALATVAIVVLWQSHFASHVSTGFHTDGVIAIDLPHAAPSERAAAFHDAFARSAGVRDVGWSSDVPGRHVVGRLATLTADGHDLPVRVTSTNAEFFKTYDIPLLAGSLQEGLHEGEAETPVALDLTAVEALGLNPPQAAIGHALKEGDRNLRVVAVTDHLRQESARHAAAPQAFYLSVAPQRVLNIRSSDLAAARRTAGQLATRYFPDDALIVETVDNYLALNYIQDRVVGILVGWTSVIALILAGFGIYALAAHTVLRKRREIVTRKLYGASNGAIARLLVREFSVLAGAGMALGTPLGYLLRQQYLAGFTLRAPFGVWPEIGALAIALAMTCVAVLRHTRSAVAMPPLLALRDS